MAKFNEFVEHMKEQLAPLGSITSRAMFGGYGIYLEGTCFAIVDDDVFYVKVDDHTRPDFEEHKLRPFSYAKKDGSTASMSYYPLPAEVMEDREMLLNWAQTAYGVALRANAKKKKPRQTDDQAN
ncbi:DNA transformation protein [Chitinivorax tropicus]|uniref:DNA transformation protein n=1 Tax=Chitinivorax tropicus TaxID=714531 RepID=A0A840ML33_9PROT|nr:TfoX/Sxy family protein [Chitinivorax tropicus]MBB5017849.1 DNA transformation protein [Chitinivorax tropicus]